MPVTNLKADWVGGDLEFQDRATGETIATIAQAAFKIAKGFQLESYAATATETGATTGTIPTGASFVTVTSGNANHIVVLPAPVPGTIVFLINGGTGYELRSSAPATVAINGGTGAGAESAIAANSMVMAVCKTATAWAAIGITGATLAGVEAAA
jgi:hypothetical protein